MIQHQIIDQNLGIPEVYYLLKDFDNGTVIFGRKPSSAFPVHDMIPGTGRF